MANVVVIGGQWGDEGKGKVVDLLCPGFKHVVRFNGGNNAGHTVRFGERHFALHLVPSGVLHDSCRCLIASGVVIDPVGLLGEIRALEQAGVDVRARLRISPLAHVVLPGHRALDAARECARGAGRIGTTGRGIGPTYETRAARTGVRMGLARNEPRLRAAVAAASAELALLAAHHDRSAAAPAAGEEEETVRALLELAPMVGDVSRALSDATEAGEAILFEGAQGTLLDVDRGTYPFVTSSGCLAGYAAPACGLPPRVIDGVLAVMKAYTTRVGGGPFPTELTEATGEHLRSRGNEFGTTTGRPRRTGWFDAVASRSAVRWNGVDAVALTKLDVLDELDEIRVAVAFTLDGRRLEHYPDDVEDIARMQPVYETLPGWRADTRGITDYEALPGRARSYLHHLEDLLHAPVVLASTGPRREETILRRVGPFDDWLPAGLPL